MKIPSLLLFLTFIGLAQANGDKCDPAFTGMFNRYHLINPEKTCGGGADEACRDTLLKFAMQNYHLTAISYARTFCRDHSNITAGIINNRGKVNECYNNVFSQLMRSDKISNAEQAFVSNVVGKCKTLLLGDAGATCYEKATNVSAPSSDLLDKTPIAY